MDAIKAALKSLFDEIIAFVKAIFAKEVGTDIEDELKGAFDDIA